MTDARRGLGQGRSTARYRALFDQSLAPLAFFDLDQHVIEANEAFASLLGAKAHQLSGRPLAELADEESCERDRVALASAVGSTSAGYELAAQRYRHATGRDLWVSVTVTVIRDGKGRPLHVVHLLDDVSGRRSQEVQLRHALRVELVAQLGSGLAHDLNNLLTVLRGQLDLLEGTLDDATRASAPLAHLHEALDRATGMTAGLLSVGRGPASMPVAVEVDALVAAVAHLVADLLGDAVVVELQLGAPGATVVVEAAQLEQALISMVLNARDAMPDGGRLTVRSRRTADQVEIEVADTGTGMDAETAAQAFTPYFTTKAPGKGTGLGLSQSRRTVRRAGGTIAIDTAPGSGTVITIGLPVAAAGDPEPRVLDLRPPAGRGARTGTPRP